MGKNERQAYLKAIRTRYRRASKASKATILDEFCAVCGYHRKYAIRLLGQRGKPKKRQRPGCKAIYHTPELIKALKRLWFATDQICSKRLKAAIPLWLPFYATVYEPLSVNTQHLLLSISAPTIDRVLKPIRLTHRTKPGIQLGPTFQDFARIRLGGKRGIDAHDDVVVVAHDRIGGLIDGKDVGQLFDAGGDPFAAVFVALANTVVFTAKQGTTHTAGDAVVPGRVRGADERGRGSN